MVSCINRDIRQLSIVTQTNLNYEITDTTQTYVTEN